MLKRIKYVLFAFAAVLLFITNIHAATITLEFTNIDLDHHDTLNIDNTTHTLQWYYWGQYSPVGFEDFYPSQAPMHVKITDNGSVLMDQDWTIWNVTPTFWTPAYSPTLTIPELHWGSSYGYAFYATGRQTINFSLGPPQTIEFIDTYGGKDWYTAKIDLYYNLPIGAPEPTSLLLLGLGLMGLAGVRRFKN